MSDKTFVTITNKMIYDRLETINKRIEKINTKANVNSGVLAIVVLILGAVIVGAV